MCNKQKPFYKYNGKTGKRFTFFYLIACLPFIGFLLSCQTGHVLFQKGSISVSDLEHLNEAVTGRDTEALWEFRDHPDAMIRSIAWRAMAISEFKDIDLLISHALNSGEAGAWYALRFQELSPEQMDALSLQFYNDLVPAGAACDLFYHQGDDRTLEMLLADRAVLSSSSECARAAGGILSRVRVPQRSINRAVELIVDAESDQTAEYLLYGFWRSPLNRPEPGSENGLKLWTMLQSRSVEMPGYTNEYLVRLTGAAGAVVALEWVLQGDGDLAGSGRMAHGNVPERVLNGPEDRGSPVQFEVETARALRTLPAEIVQESVLPLLNRPNPHIGLMAMESLQQIRGLDQEWLAGLTDQMIHFPKHPETVLAALELLHLNQRSIAGDFDLLENIDARHPALKNRVLALYRSYMDRADFLGVLDAGMEAEGIGALHSAQALIGLIRDEGMVADIRIFTREMMKRALQEQNRSVLASSEPILSNPKFFNRGDQELIVNSLNRAMAGSDRAVAQVLLSSLEALGLADPLAQVELPFKPMRKPDWNRLSELGENPEWLLETNRGRIVIRLDPLNTPFTVSSIVALTGEGFFDGVSFHRVVRNFVIQGGDFDRRDGFGGPDYRIPTEPSFQTFSRGSVGMASSGPDTEGSQFFITHTRTPHLDGLYTLFGQVIEGMDVVDRIEMGDVVLSGEVIRVKSKK